MSTAIESDPSYTGALSLTNEVLRAGQFAISAARHLEKVRLDSGRVPDELALRFVLGVHAVAQITPPPPSVRPDQRISVLAEAYLSLAHAELTDAPLDSRLVSGIDWTYWRREMLSRLEDNPTPPHATTRRHVTRSSHSYLQAFEALARGQLRFRPKI